MFIINSALLTIVSTLFTICLFFLIECIAALFSKANLDEINTNWQDITIAVLVPAHDEELVIASTLEQLVPILKKQDSLIVIADNCSDATAEIARANGATVIERQDSVRKGKGYALDYGLQFITASPPDVVIVIDADCTVHQSAIEKLSERAVTTGYPVQATYLIAKPKNSNSSKDLVSQFSNIVRNLVRPLGLTYLQIPSSLHGTGMAFPWSTTQKVSFANGHLLEDLKLGLDLTLVGHKPIFCPQARVTGYFPSSNQAAKSQRTRWEHGHLQLIQTYVPILIKEAWHQKRLDMVGSILDLCVPPLSLLAIIWLAITTVSLVFGVFTGLWVPYSIATAAGFCFLTAIFIAWSKFARQDLPLYKLLTIPFYVLWKIPVYFQFLIKPQRVWVRTERNKTL
jgi:cellulose synthase/poly-beta-1,6-N-acetylglucosamine synthase-like glycosyltransferase